VFAYRNVLLRHATVSSNTSNYTSAGTGICNAVAAIGTASIISSTIEANISNHDGAAACAQGGLTLDSSTISGNFGIGIEADSNTLLINSTISGNSKDGIYQRAQTLKVYNSTIAFNNIGIRAGGIANMYSSIVAKNASYDFYQGPSGGGAYTLSLIGKSNIGEFGNDVNPLITPLANHGGSVKTHGLSASSPAIDHGINLKGQAYDQRGLGYLRFQGTAPDIGAFERQPDDDELFYDGFD
jgi:Right handed beta helix region